MGFLGLCFRGLCFRGLGFLGLSFLDTQNILGSICFSKQIFYRKESLDAPDYSSLNGGWCLIGGHLMEVQLYTEWDDNHVSCIRNQ